MTDPQAFLPQPGGFPGPTYRPTATPPSQTQEPRVPYGRPITPGPGNNLPALSIAYPNTLTLTKALQVALNLRGGAYIHLVVPIRRGGDWYLDTHPKPGVGNPIPKSGRAMLRVAPIGKMHFQLSKPTFAGSGRGGLTGLGNPLTLAPRLHFVLGEEVPGHAGYYRLSRLSTLAVNH